MDRITLKTIAEKLGVSISTVSRALKDHPDIKQETRERIKEMALKEDYEPNHLAVNLRTSENKLFGLIVPKLSQFFYHSVIAAIDETARLTGYKLLILQSNDTVEKEIENIKICLANRVSGLFVALSSETVNYDHFDRLIKRNIPVLFFDKVPENDHYNKVAIDDSEAASLAARELLVRSKKRVLAIFGKANLSISRKRKEGFVSTFAKYSADHHIATIEASSSEEAQLKSEDFLQDPKNGDTQVIFCMSDEILVGVMQTCMKLDLKIPSQIGVIALSNGIFPKYYYPAVSYVETSGQKLGIRCVHRMFELLNGDPFIQELGVDVLFVDNGSL
jgi:LacI family transcriptional regulator